MQDITDEILALASCCQDVWKNWFASLENGEDEFINVEDALFSALVLSKIESEVRWSVAEFFQRVKAGYKIDANDHRSICSTSIKGTIYCRSEKILINRRQMFSVNSIDFMGTMLEGIPYAELHLEANRFVLEPIKNLNFKIENI